MGGANYMCDGKKPQKTYIKEKTFGIYQSRVDEIRKKYILTYAYR